MTQIRQARIFYLGETKEYQVKLFINNREQINPTCFTKSLDNAREKARKIERNTFNLTEDFCKTELAKYKKKQMNVIKNEFPIYNVKTSEVIGWIELNEKEFLPQEITIRDKTYQKE